MRKILLGFLTCFCLVSTFYLVFVNHTEQTEVGLAWNRITGDIWLQDRAGWKFSEPWVAVSRIDIRPIRVCVTSSGRGFNCKLVRFQPVAYLEFVETQGFRYYWLSNRISFNFGYDEEYRGMKDILRGYAYSAKKYSFISVIDDYRTQQICLEWDKFPLFCLTSIVLNITMLADRLSEGKK